MQNFNELAWAGFLLGHKSETQKNESGMKLYKRVMSWPEGKGNSLLLNHWFLPRLLLVWLHQTKLLLLIDVKHRIH